MGWAGQSFVPLCWPTLVPASRQCRMADRAATVQPRAARVTAARVRAVARSVTVARAQTRARAQLPAVAQVRRHAVKGCSAQRSRPRARRSFRARTIAVRRVRIRAATCVRNRTVNQGLTPKSSLATAAQRVSPIRRMPAQKVKSSMKRCAASCTRSTAPVAARTAPSASSRSKTTLARGAARSFCQLNRSTITFPI